MVVRSTGLPRHAVVRSALEHQISTGALRPGHQVPTEPQLMERFQVSRTTVRRALRDLEILGLISRQAGRGTFVREPHVEPRLDRLSGFVEDMEALGLRASATVVLIEREPAPNEVTDALGLRSGATAVHIQRVRLANDVPISFDDSWFPESPGERIAKEDLEEEPFYSILENKYGTALAGADYVVRAIAATPQLAAHLQVAASSPILQLTRLTRQKPDRRPVLFEHLYYAGYRTSYQLTVDR